MFLTFDYETGNVLTPSGRVIDSQPSVGKAAEAWPDAVFRVVNLSVIL